MYIPQTQLKRVKALLEPGKVVVIFGPHHVDKTTLLQRLLKEEIK